MKGRLGNIWQIVIALSTLGGVAGLVSLIASPFWNERNRLIAALAESDRVMSASQIQSGTSVDEIERRLRGLIWDIRDLAEADLDDRTPEGREELHERINEQFELLRSIHSDLEQLFQPLQLCAAQERCVVLNEDSGICSDVLSIDQYAFFAGHALEVVERLQPYSQIIHNGRYSTHRADAVAWLVGECPDLEQEYYLNTWNELYATHANRLWAGSPPARLSFLRDLFYVSPRDESKFERIIGFIQESEGGQ